MARLKKRRDDFLPVKRPPPLKSKHIHNARHFRFYFSSSVSEMQSSDFKLVKETQVNLKKVLFT